MAIVQTDEDYLRNLMIEALAGSEPSYRRLLTVLASSLRRYYERRMGSGHAAVEDLVQEALLAVHSRRFTYDPDRPFTAWAYAIARYKLIDHLRRSRTQSVVPIDDIGDLFAPGSAEASDARIDIERALATLPAGRQGLIRAVKIEGRSIGEVSSAAGISEAAVKVAIHRGLRQIARRLRGSDAS